VSDRLHICFESSQGSGVYKGVSDNEGICRTDSPIGLRGFGLDSEQIICEGSER